MEYKKLPQITEDKYMEFPHFPNRFYGAVFRLWETCGAERLARALDLPVEIIEKAAEDMGLPEPQCPDKWLELGYISIIRSAWHILPYSQLLKLLDWTEDRLASVLKEDDFLDVKLGIKPYCDEIKLTELTEAGKKQLAEIKKIMIKNFSGMPKGRIPFDFFTEDRNCSSTDVSEDLRMVYSYCGLYANALDCDVALSYPGEILKIYKASGVNAVWLPVVLYQITPFPFDESVSAGWEKRQEKLRELIKLAEEYDIKVYLYLNEPRCMPLEFFDKHPELLGATHKGKNGALCTSVQANMDYLYNAVKKLCEDVPGIGGFFTITCSENVTHCKSKPEVDECPRCKEIPIYKLVSDVLRTISDAAWSVNPDLRIIAWSWSWDSYMSEDELKKCIDLIPEKIVIQSNSEAKKKFIRGGVEGEVRDYSISVPGPAPVAEFIWDYARQKGHEVCAKVQVNVTWECSTVPFLPVFDLIREHMTGLKEIGVKHLMLSWTLGGYPSINLKIASECLKNPDEQSYIALLKEEFGEYWNTVKKAATCFSEAFKNFPFHIDNLYKGPQNAGPSNLLYLKPSGFNATMTCYALDSLDIWRANYPREVYIDLLKKLKDEWGKGLELIKDMPDCEFKQCAYAAYAIFYSSYLQADFINNRENGDNKYLSEIADKEKELAVFMYGLMQKNNYIGYEAANHYYYTRSMLAEKVVNCEYIKKML